MYTKTKKLSIPVSPEIASFAVCLESYLESRGLDLLESWEGVPLEEVVHQLRDKIVQLDPDRLSRANPHALFEHAISMGCYVMMLSELVFQRSGIEREQLQSIPSVMLLPALKKDPMKA
jgi:hypothetical protein